MPASSAPCHSAATRPSASVTPDATTTESLESSTATPAAGRPTEVSRMWVLTPAHAATTLLEAQDRDLPELLGDHGDLLLRRMQEPGVERIEHLARAATGGADQEDAVEPILVGEVAGDERALHLAVRDIHAGLLGMGVRGLGARTLMRARRSGDDVRAPHRSPISVQEPAADCPAFTSSSTSAYGRPSTIASTHRSMSTQTRRAARAASGSRALNDSRLTSSAPSRATPASWLGERDAGGAPCIRSAGSLLVSRDREPPGRPDRDRPGR